MLNQPIKKKILPKKPIDIITNEDDYMLLEDINIHPGEFHSDWERNLWGGGDEFSNSPDLFYDVTGLDNFVHVEETSNRIQEALDLQNLNSHSQENENYVGQDPMMQEVSLQDVQGDFQVVTENGNISRVIENAEMIMEINLETISANSLPKDALIIADAGTIDNLPLPDAISEDEDSISFNHTSFDDRFEENFQGLMPENIEDSALDVSLEASLSIEDSKEIETDFIENNLVRKRVGRPPKKTRTAVTTVPFGGPKKIIEQAKKRRLRDLNNIASQKCRAKKRQEGIIKETLCRELENKNTLLKRKFESLENKVKIFRNYMIQSGISVDQYQ